MRRSFKFFLMMFLFVGFTVSQFAAAASNDGLPDPKPGLGHAKGTMTYNGVKKKGITVHMVVADALPKDPIKTETDDQGNWVFLDLAPGRYCPMVFEGKPEPLAFTEEAMKVLFKEVKAGAITDFGDVKRAWQ